MEKFHFLFHLEAKTNKRKKSFCRFSSISIVFEEWKQTAEKSFSRSFWLNKKSRENKISMETTPMMKEKKEGEKIWNVFHLRQYFFSSFISSGWIPSLSQVGKSVFHIKITFAWHFFSVFSQTTKLLFLLQLTISQMCEIPWSILLSSRKRQRKTFSNDDSESIRSY